MGAGLRFLHEDIDDFAFKLLNEVGVGGVGLFYLKDPTEFF